MPATTGTKPESAGDYHLDTSFAAPPQEQYLAVLCIMLQGIREVFLHIEKDLVAASSTPLVLGILAGNESYGYAVLQKVRELSDGELEWTDGMLYPLLHRLQRLGYVTSEWRTPVGGRRRKYYVITDAGRAALAVHRRQWAAVNRTLDDVWQRFSAHRAFEGM